MTETCANRRHHGLAALRAAFYFALFVSACAGRAALAQSLYELAVAPAFGRTYPPDRWVPLRIELRNNGSAAVEGAVVIPVTQTSTAVVFRVPVSVPSKSRVVITAYAYLPDKTFTKLTSGAVPVAIAEWVGIDGARLARTEVLGRPDTAGKPGTTEAAGPPGFLILAVSGRDQPEVGDIYQVRGLAEFVAGIAPYPINLGESDPASLPRHRSGYDAVRAIVLNQIDPDTLDASQRQAILEYLRAGGTLILPAPLGPADPAGSWLGPFMPVQLTGRRQADQIAASTRGSVEVVKFRQFAVICEATEASGEVLLRDEYYVHAAVRRVGLGRVIFLSFPVDALDHGSAQTVAIWRKLLNLDAPAYGWISTALGQERDSVLEGMIGVPTAPWSLAVAVAGGYLALTLLLHLVIRGANRPLAFVLGSGIAIAAFAGLLGASIMGRGDKHHLSGARLAVVDLGATGGGVMHEAMVFLGRDEPNFTLQADPHVALRPGTSAVSDPPLLDQLPFAARNAAVRSGRIENVWQASAPIADDRTLLATAQFTDQGIRVEVDNRIGQEIVAPLLLWNWSAFRLPNIPPGRGSWLLGASNSPGDFTNTLVFTGEEALLRGRIVRLLRSPRTDAGALGAGSPPPVLVGWLALPKSGAAEPVVHFSTTPDLMRNQIMLRVALRVSPSAPGTTVHIPEEFVTAIFDSARGAPYDPERHEWVQTLQTGAWCIGFQPPPNMGRLSSPRATIRADLAAPAVTIVLRRGQCKASLLEENVEGPVIAEWDRQVGSKAVTVDLDHTDLDADGRFWLRVAVDPSRKSAGPMPAEWRINDLSVELSGKVQSPPSSSHLASPNHYGD